jgi:RHS repeat-associated protein
MKKMVHPRSLSGMNGFMEWSHASLDHVRRCSSRKRAVAGSPSSQPSVNSVSSVVQHDPKGNLTDSVNGFVYTYDSKNRLLSAVSTDQGVNLTQTYDADNKVVSRTLNGTTRYFIYDGWSLIAEYNSTGDLVKRYVHGAGIDEILVQTQGSTDAFYHHDALGSTVLLTNASGNIVRSYEYDAFGQVSNPPSVEDMFSADPYANRFLYTGREFLKEANLYDYRNRVYSAELGRFLQTDPIRFDAGDVNLYRYVANNPVNGVDPLGLAAGWNWLPGAAIKTASMAAQKNT